MAGSVLFLKLLCLLKVQEFLVTLVLKAATSPSCKTLNAIYFPNLSRTLRSYFFARKLMKIVIEKSCVIMEN
jgi:hypothetical protein